MNAISLLDLKSADEHDLFDSERFFQNWTGVFTYNHPTIALILSDQLVEPGLVRGFDHSKLRGRFIAEAEACYCGEIPVSWITEGCVIGRRYRLIFRSSDLTAVLRRAEQVQRYSRRHPSGLIGLLSAVDIEQDVAGNSRRAGQLTGL